MIEMNQARLRRAIQAGLGFVLASLVTTSAQAADFTGLKTSGVYTFYNEDVYIDDVTVDCSAPSFHAPPGGIRGIHVIVHGGNIHVNGPIDASGADGVDGVDGDRDNVPTAGTAGKGGCDVILETRSHAGSLSDWSVSIGEQIDLRGGRGGHGGDGAAGFFDDDCGVEGAQDGATAGAGGAGGNFTVIAAGNVDVGAGVLTQGGPGGHGGSGGHGGPFGPGGLARPGREGGRGGNITIRHSVAAPPDASFGIAAGALSDGALSASGGDGGHGGNGGSDSSQPKNGGNGGTGGAGGAVVVEVRRFAMTGQLNIPTFLTSEGGHGGRGGDGGTGGDTDCPECDDSEWEVGGGEGAQGGLGGHGGHGGSVDITVVESASLVYGLVSSNGGDGESAGFSGLSGTEINGFCFGDPDCPKDYSPYGGKIGAPAGNGGAAGAITIQAESLSVAPSAAVSARGGDGADAVPGSVPGAFCCVPGVPATTGAGAQGGSGGHGGAGADITLVVTASSFTIDRFITCGGDGQDGGAGSYGTPVGPGGVGGDGEPNGHLVVNGAILPSLCQPLNGVDGPPGDNGDAPFCDSP